MTILSLKTMIRARDLSASRDFYTGLLGLAVVEEWDSPGDRGVILGFGPAGGFLEILEVNAALPKHRPAFNDPVANDKIELQIHVDDVDSWAERIMGAVEIDGPVSRPWGNRYLWIRDPDGVRIALFQGPT